MVASVKLLPKGLVVLPHSRTCLKVQFQAMFFLLPFYTTKLYLSCTLRPSVFPPTSTAYIPFSKIWYRLPWKYASGSHPGSQNKWEKLWTCREIFRLAQDWKEILKQREKQHFITLGRETSSCTIACWVLVRVCLVFFYLSHSGSVTKKRARHEGTGLYATNTSAGDAENLLEQMSWKLLYCILHKPQNWQLLCCIHPFCIKYTTFLY